VGSGSISNVGSFQQIAKNAVTVGHRLCAGPSAGHQPSVNESKAHQIAKDRNTLGANSGGTFLPVVPRASLRRIRHDDRASRRRLCNSVCGSYSLPSTQRSTPLSFVRNTILMNGVTHCPVRPGTDLAGFFEDARNLANV
jgi:hypothetical protein